MPIRKIIAEFLRAAADKIEYSFINNVSTKREIEAKVPHLLRDTEPSVSYIPRPAIFAQIKLEVARFFLAFQECLNEIKPDQQLEFIICPHTNGLSRPSIKSLEDALSMLDEFDHAQNNKFYFIFANKGMKRKVSADPETIPFLSVNKEDLNCGCKITPYVENEEASSFNKKLIELLKSAHNLNSSDFLALDLVECELEKRSFFNPPNIEVDFGKDTSDETHPHPVSLFDVPEN